MYNTPILFITFNRPLHTLNVWDKIIAQKPAKLFIFQDGARLDNNQDAERCLSVQKIVSQPLTWNCARHFWFAETNMGCGSGPAAAISWFFSLVEQGVIIEDDAVPADDFFVYAEELLIRYQDNENVRAIGSMKIDPHTYGDGSYYFSMMNRTLCAWATWRRAWNDFDYRLQGITKKELYKALDYYHATLREKEYWYERLLEIQKDRLKDTSWDQQFWISIWLKKGMGIVPNHNLSSNIGFDAEATHTTNQQSIAAKRATESILPLVHPSGFEIQRKADLQFHKLYFTPFEYGISGLKRLHYRINKRIKRMVNHTGPWIKKINASIHLFI